MGDLAPRWATLAALLLVGAPVTAQVSGDETGSETKEVTVVARESGCPDDDAFCFSLEDSPPNLSQGDEVTLALRNTDDNGDEHSVHVTVNESADPDHHNTSSEDAIANTTTIVPGETTSTNFTVPDGEALYLWCDVTGHEASGMWTTIELREDDGTEDDEASENETSGNAGEENDTGGNRTTRDESDDDPLEPTAEEPPDRGRDSRGSPLGWPLFAAALVAAAVGLYVSRHGA